MNLQLVLLQPILSHRDNDTRLDNNMAQQARDTAAQDEENMAFRAMTSLFDDLVLEGEEGALEAVQQLIELTNPVLPADNNMTHALEQYLERNDIRDIFRRARSGNQEARAQLMTIDERTRPVLPAGRRVQDKYRAYIATCVAEAQRSRNVRKGRKC